MSIAENPPRHVRGRVTTGRAVALLAAVVAALGLVLALGVRVFGIAPNEAIALRQLVRYVGAEVGEHIYRADRQDALERIAKYYVGERIAAPVEFVYESPDAPHLVAFRERYGLDAIVEGPGREFDAMLRLAAWVGGQFHHATDAVPGGHYACDPVALIEAGRRGSGFWCEIAARTMVQAATAVGWPARVITASNNPYIAKHAVAELWSNQHDKWVVFDTDFNVYFEADGVPLSAFELAMKGEALRAEGRLKEPRFGPLKPGLRPQVVSRLFRYVHVDMRTDWCTRPLSRGSPARGDRATRWVAEPGYEPFLSAARHEPDQKRFDWPVNHVSSRIVHASGGASRTVIELSTYSPFFRRFEYRVDGGPWTALEGHRIAIDAPSRAAVVSARVVPMRGEPGPVHQLTLTSKVAARP